MILSSEMGDMRHTIAQTADEGVPFSVRKIPAAM